MNRKLFWVFVLVSMVALVIWFLVVVLKNGQTKLIFCDVGQGNGVMLTRGEFQLVYDTGPKNGRMLDCLTREMPFWDKKIEVVIISHWDSDHGGGLAQIVEFYEIDNLYTSKTNEQYNYAKILASDDMIRCDWMEFRVVWSDSREDDNYGSVVGLLDIDDFEVLLMGDVPIEVEQRLVWSSVKRDLDLAQSLKSVEVLLVGHHGSRGSTSEELLELLTVSNASMEAVISVGKNSFGHPTREVLNRLDKYGIKVRRTDKDGDVRYRL